MQELVGHFECCLAIEHNNIPLQFYFEKVTAWGKQSSGQVARSYECDCGEHSPGTTSIRVSQTLESYRLLHRCDLLEQLVYTVQWNMKSCCVHYCSIYAYARTYWLTTCGNERSTLTSARKLTDSRLLFCTLLYYTIGTQQPNPLTIRTLSKATQELVAVNHLTNTSTEKFPPPSYQHLVHPLIYIPSPTSALQIWRLTDQI